MDFTHTPYALHQPVERLTIYIMVIPLGCRCCKPGIVCLYVTWIPLGLKKREMHWNYQTEVLGSRLSCLWLEPRGHFAILWLAAASVACCSNYCNDYRCIHSRLYGTSASCLAPPSVYCSFESQAGCFFTFHFIQPAIRMVRMLCCMRYVVLTSKASMTVTLKSLGV